MRIQELIDKDKELSYRNIEFINKAQNQNKDDKISTIIDDVNCGAIIFNEEDEEYIQQIIDFTGQKTSLHDDAPDCTSDLTKWIDEIEVVQFITVMDKKVLGL